MSMRRSVTPPYSTVGRTIRRIPARRRDFSVISFSSKGLGACRNRATEVDLRLYYALSFPMAEKRRPSDGPPGMPPSRNLGVGNASCGGRHEADVSDPLELIVASGARKEKLQHRDYSRAALKLAPRPAPRRRQYAEMRASSAFSFLDAASLPEDLVEEAARLEIPAVALVERNGVYGAPRFWKAAKAAGIRALVGAEVTLRAEGEQSHPEARRAEGSRTRLPEWRSSSGSFASLRMTAEEKALRMTAEGRAPRTAQRKTQDPRHDVRLTLLVENRTGYKNLCRLITAGALGKPKGETAVTLEQVAEHAEGLHVATGGDESPVARALMEGGVDGARALLEKLVGIFPKRLHVELQRHHLREEERRNVALADLARSLRLPIFATNGVRYAREKDKELHDVLTCIRNHVTLDNAGRVLAAQRER